MPAPTSIAILSLLSQILVASIGRISGRGLFLRLRFFGFCRRRLCSGSFFPSISTRNVPVTGLWSLCVASTSLRYSRTRTPKGLNRILSVKAGTRCLWDISYDLVPLSNLKVGGNVIFPSAKPGNAAPSDMTRESWSCLNKESLNSSAFLSSPRCRHSSIFITVYSVISRGRSIL